MAGVVATGQHRHDTRTGLGPAVATGLLVVLSLLLPHSTSAAERSRSAGVARESGVQCIHVVRRGESIDRIAASRGTTREALIRANRLRHPDGLRVGERLAVPGCKSASLVRSRPSARSSRGALEKGASSGGPVKSTSRPGAEVNARLDRTRFIWPVQGQVTSGFGRRGLWGWHRGVDIQAPQGAPIRAAAAGTVVFSGRESSYGRVIKIAHPNGLTTVYAHNRTNLVKVADRVNAGTVIGAVGHTGRATGDHLHFETRRNGLPQNPLSVLPHDGQGPTLAKHQLTAGRRHATARDARGSETRTARSALN